MSKDNPSTEHRPGIKYPFKPFDESIYFKPLDWTNPKEYPEPEDLTRKQWAWEFLRRNYTYNRDLDLLIFVGRILNRAGAYAIRYFNTDQLRTLIKRALKSTQSWGEAVSWAYVEFGRASVLFNKDVRPLSEGTIAALNEFYQATQLENHDSDWLYPRVADPVKFLSPHEGYLIEKFCLSPQIDNLCYPCEELSKAEADEFFPDIRQPLRVYKEVHTKLAPEEIQIAPEQIAIVFILDKTISDQIKLAHIHLKQLVKERKRPPMRRLPDYIRILDAMWSGAKYKDIVEAGLIPTPTKRRGRKGNLRIKAINQPTKMSGSNDAVWERIRAARYWRDEGYVDFYGPPKKSTP